MRLLKRVESLEAKNLVDEGDDILIIQWAREAGQELMSLGNNHRTYHRKPVESESDFIDRVKGIERGFCANNRTRLLLWGE
ncbi:MAG: hypothetical protein HQK62_07350 [Desulfamplus sp.]|nr:hypothetical protein [Desulfamplus sp.]